MTRASFLPDDLRDFLTAHLAPPSGAANAPQSACASGADLRPTVLADWAARRTASQAPQIVCRAFGEAVTAAGAGLGDDAWTFQLGAGAVYDDYADLPHRLREFCRDGVAPRVAATLGVRDPDPDELAHLGDYLAEAGELAALEVLRRARRRPTGADRSAGRTALIERPGPAPRPAAAERRPSVALCKEHLPQAGSYGVFDLSDRPLWPPETKPRRTPALCQGDVGDCWLLAVLAAFFHQAPERLKDLVQLREDKRYTVHLDRPVDVGPLVHTTGQDTDRALYASFEQFAWVAVIEKAVARRYLAPWRDLFTKWLRHGTPHQRPESYDTLHGGRGDRAMDLLGWRPSKAYGDGTGVVPGVVGIAEDGLERGRLVVVSLKTDTIPHAYAVLKRMSDGFVLFDPHCDVQLMFDTEFADKVQHIFVSGPYQPPPGLPLVDRIP